MFLFATYVMRPRYPHLTSQKGWMQNPDNLIYDEQVGFAKKMRDKDMIRSNVVIDLANKKILKCSVADRVGTDFDAIHQYFYENYQKYLDELGYPYVSKQPEPETMVETESTAS